MPFVSVTRLRVRKLFYMPGFTNYAIRSYLQGRKTEGNLFTEIGRDSGLVFWTKTVWATEAAMRAFRNSGDHRTVMPKLATWCDEATYVHWSQEDSGLPSWHEACTRLIEGGTVSRVHFPSANHPTRTFSLDRMIALGGKSTVAGGVSGKNSG
jgi:hypothetical protein